MPANLSTTNTHHHIKGLRPALQIMSELGFSQSECLQGTGIDQEALNDPERGISLIQEFDFYRHLAALSQDPLLGLKLGQAYRLESYGVFGYAILSAANLLEALSTACQYNALSFSHFDFKLEQSEGLARLQMHPRNPIPADLLTLFEDRDCSAVLAGAGNALGQDVPLKHIKLMHKEQAAAQAYADFYHCPLSFNHAHTEIAFDAAMLSMNMPLRDAKTAAYCREQCESLLTEYSQGLSFSERVKALLYTACGEELPSIKEVAKALHTSERSLRRQLSKEGCSFQEVLNAVRFQRAKDYLKRGLSLEEISHLLGYSEVANFSHAFKRWSGVSPSHYKRGKAC